MTCFFRSDVGQFLSLSDEHVLAHLGIGYANRGYTLQFAEQTLTWGRDLSSLRQTLEHCVANSDSANAWGILLEFAIPRKELRIDAVLLVRDVIVAIEAKAGYAASAARHQAEEYALLLHYFHKASDRRRIIPIVVSPEAGEPDLLELNQRSLFPQLATFWVSKVVRSTWSSLAKLLISLEDRSGLQISLDDWNFSPYYPIPSILEAAVALKSGLSIREIAHTEASLEEIEDVRATVQDCLDKARNENRHAICFLTGVPGSGKTLVGLSLAHSDGNKAEAIHFMSGNGPLVKVLQHLFTQESRKSGANAPQAKAEAQTLIENVHRFARTYTEDDPRPPANHAIIFDEAQRAWNRSQNMRKFSRDYSEPEMLLRIMERHEDWAVVVALVGGGQEINDGEAGLEEWGRALGTASKDWLIYASPEALDGGASTADHRLFARHSESRPVHATPTLHLRTSHRSLRAEQLATWVNRVIDGDADGAAALKVTERFPIFLSRDLDATRKFLRHQSIGQERCGLVGSSAATRLRAEGLEPSSTFHADYQWEYWYLAPQTDIRSSYRCEVFATEFEIQGLELDWIGLCWGGDFLWNPKHGWQLSNLRPGKITKWSPIKKEEKRTYRKNSYRVLLTRARKGMVIFVPRGNDDDPTNSSKPFELTAQYLLHCGVTSLIADSEQPNPNPSAGKKIQETLF